MTTPTSSLPSATLAGLSSELQKIAEETKSPKLKKWLKNTALISAGYGAGQGLGMLGEEALRAALGKKWNGWSSDTKRKVIGTALGLATAGSLLSVANLEKKKAEYGSQSR